MCKSQQKNLIKYCKIFNARDLTDIPPTLWKYIGLYKIKEDKLNFLIKMIYNYNN